MTTTQTASRSSYPVSQNLPQDSSQNFSPNDRRHRSKSRRNSSLRSGRTLQAVAPHQTTARSPIPSIIRPSLGTSQPRSLHGHRRKSRRLYYVSLISEAGLKIVINALLLTAFAVALGRLLPQMWRNNQQRIAIETELEVTQKRVDTLEQHFSQAFAPNAPLDLIEQQSYQVDPQKQRIVFLDKPVQE